MSRAPTRRLGRIRGSVAFAVATMAISSFATLSFAGLMPLMRDDLHLSGVLVGGVASATYIAALVTAIPAGRLADRVGAAKLIAGAQVVIAAGLAAMAVASGKVFFFLGVAVVGGGYGMVTPATNLLAAGSRQNRGWNMSVKQAGVTVGGILAAAVLPELASAFDWRAALLLPILTCLGIGVASARLAPESAVEARPSSARPAPPGAAIVLGAYGFLMSGIQFIIFGYLAVYLVDYRGESATLAGTELSVVFVGASIGRLIWGFVSDRYFAVRASSLQVAAAGSCVMIAVLPLGAGTAAGWPLMALLGFCSSGWNGVYQAVIADSAPQQGLGRATGTALVFVFLGAVVLPPAFGLTMHLTSSWPENWLVAAACPAIALFLLRLLADTQGPSLAGGEPG